MFLVNRCVCVFDGWRLPTIKQTQWIKHSIWWVGGWLVLFLTYRVVLFTVNATCGNNSVSPWTQCSQHCGIGLSSRHSRTAKGCQKLSDIRLCSDRRCRDTDGHQPPFSVHEQHRVRVSGRLLKYVNKKCRINSPATSLLFSTYLIPTRTSTERS